MPPGPDPLVGSTVGHYQILERLGAGGMGEVYLAEDLKLKRKAAIKFIAADIFRDPARRERFVQEAMLAASIDHPHVAAIYDIDQFGDRTFIAMEYVHGATVRELLQQGSPPLRRVLDISIQVADALAKVHQHGVIHRDLKPENVIVSSDGYAKLIDFGLAKPAGSVAAAASAETAIDRQVHTADGLVMGTVAYMSPEQARGALLDPRSDIFSFGVLLHELLTGVAPFRRASAAETLSAILTAAAPDVRVSDSAIAPELQRIVRKCLVKDADGRYQSMRDIVVDLRGVRDVLASGAPVTAATMPAAPVATRGRRLAAIAVVSAVTAIAIAGWMWPRRATPSTAPGSTGRPAVAVMSFENLSGATETAWLSAGLPSMLVTGLAQNPEIEVITADRLNEAARHFGVTQFAAIEPAARLDVVKRAGATTVVNGTIIRGADELRIDARVEDLATGRVILADTVRGRDPLALADDLAARIRRGLNVRTADSVRPVGELSSRSVDAYRLYALGVEAADNVRTGEAIKLFKQAVDLDPDFALAHFWLYWTGGFPLAERIAHLKEAAKHLDRLSERDALIVEAHLAESEGRGTDALAKYDRLMARYPDARDGYVGAAFYYLAIDRADRAIEIMERAAAAMPADGPTFNTLGYIYLADGRGAMAIEAFEKYVDLRPKEPNSLDSLAEGFLATGDVSRAMETAQQANAAGHLDAPTTIAWIQAVQGQYDEALKGLTRPSIAGVFARAHVGRYRDAEALTARLGGLPDAAMTAIRDMVRATLALERGDCRHALALLSASAKAAPFHEIIVATNRTGRPPQGQRRLIFDLVSGTCEARTGQVDAARARLTQHRSVLTTGPYPLLWLGRLLEGEIALAAGDIRGAAAAFEAAGPARRLPFIRSGMFPITTVPLNNVFLRDGLARVRAAEGQLDDAIAIYRGLLSAGPESKFTAFYEPRYVLAIARLLEKSGKQDEARREYSRFLELWKDADPDLPELAEARAKTR